MTGPVRVLVVDDSKVMRKLLSDLLEGDPDITVVGTARDGADALAKIDKLDPDLVTLDIEMPKMDGLTTLQHIMSENPLPVIMVSAMDKRQADVTMKALDLGAVDFVPKTSGALSLDIEKAGDTILAKVKTAMGVRVRRRESTGPLKPIVFRGRSMENGSGLVVIGASTGGPKAIPEVLGRLPRNIPAAVLIVQHMPRGFTRSFAERLNWYTSLEVREAQEGEEIRPGEVLVAPGDQHMEVNGKRVYITNGPQVNHVRPSVDVLMKSAATAHGRNCVGVLLTGMGSDGAQGMRAIRSAGGATIAQDEQTSVVYGMPKAAVDLRAAGEVLPLDEIAGGILRALEA